jgi:hypothetical protein
MFILVGGGRFHASLLPVLWSSKPLGAREFFCLSLTCSSEGCVPPESYPVEVLSPNLMGCRVLCLFSFFLCVLWQEGFHTTFGFRVWPFPAWCCRCFSGWASKVCLFHRLDCVISPVFFRHAFPSWPCHLFLSGAWLVRVEDFSLVLVRASHALLFRPLVVVVGGLQRLLGY